jgi:osmoprotectant transport system permease protein
VVALPLGILAAKQPRVGQLVLGSTGVLLTIPSMALLLLLIPVLNIGAPPTLAALFLYSLLPIVRNTYTGLHDIPLSLRESAEALGLPPLAQLRLIELPLASQAILAGIQTAAVLNVGTAAIGGLIGAGGYGETIFRGIQLDNRSLILQGAVPIAVLALFMQGFFELLGRFVVPRGLRLKPT